MWDRKQLKANGRAAVKANYWHCVIVSIFILVFASGQGFGGLGQLRGNISYPGASPTTNTGVVNEFVLNITGNDLAALRDIPDAIGAYQGALTRLFDNVTSSGSVVFGVLNALNQMLFNDRVMPGITILVGVLVTFLYWLLFQNILYVGRCRFFLENRGYTKTRPGRLMMVYRVRRMGNAAKIMFLQTLYLILWAFTIVGLFIKLYSYRMLPYIVAENPDISAKDAFRLSRQMMKGNKWRAFVLDLSFLGWLFLSVISFGLVYVFYADPYISAADAELYMALRGARLQAVPQDTALLNDTWLPGAVDGGAYDEYPTMHFPLPERRRLRAPADYHRRYALTDYILLFFTFSMIGYIYEVIYYLFYAGMFINRGTMYGPWLPVYGCGGVLSLFVLRRWVDKPILTFFLAAGLCGTLEYFTAWALETFFHTKWWDYTGFFLNIQGRVCLEGLIVFGLGCCLGIYVLSPALAGLYERIPKPIRNTLCTVLCGLFATDLAFSALHPNVAGGLQSLH